MQILIPSTASAATIFLILSSPHGCICLTILKITLKIEEITSSRLRGHWIVNRSRRSRHMDEGSVVKGTLWTCVHVRGRSVGMMGRVMVCVLLGCGEGAGPWHSVCRSVLLGCQMYYSQYDLQKTLHGRGFGCKENLWTCVDVRARSVGMMGTVTVCKSWLSGN
jgi:hypothetical protein